MLIGQYTQIINEKGRCALPSKHRDKLGGSVIIARWYEGCLVIVSRDKWEALLNRLTGKTEVVTLPVRDTDRFILGSAYEADLDSQGRFVIPKQLREYAGLSENVVFVGLGDRVEVWDGQRWEQKEKEIQKNAPELVEKIAQVNKPAGQKQ